MQVGFPSFVRRVRRLAPVAQPRLHRQPAQRGALAVCAVLAAACFGTHDAGSGGGAGGTGSAGTIGTAGLAAGGGSAGQPDVAKRPAVDGVAGSSAAEEDEAPCKGDYTITSAADAAAVASCTSVYYLEIRDFAPEVTLPLLKRVIGHLVIRSDGGPLSVSLPALATVDGNLIVRKGETVSGPVTLDPPELTTLGGDFDMQFAFSTSLNLPSLTSVGGAFILVGTLTLTSLELPALATVGGGLSLVAIAPPGVRLPSLTRVAGMFVFSSNRTSALSAPLLTSTGAFMIFSNSNLPPSQVNAILQQLVATGEVRICGNLGEDPCG